MKIYNILVFPAGTEIAFEIHNSLKYFKYVKLFGGTSVSCHADFVFKNIIDGFPFVYEKGFLKYLNKKIKENNIDFIYPAHDDASLFFAENSNKIKARIINSPKETIEICRSKNKTYSFFSNRNYIPKHYLNIDDIISYPVFVKPSIGQGSFGAELVANRSDLIRKISDGIVYSICEYLPGDEYTVDCFTDKNGELRSITLRDRERIRNGIAVRSKILNLNSRIKEIANDINKSLVFNGAWFFQVKKDINDEYKLLEISARIPGTMGVSRNLGINYPLLTFYNFLGYNVDIIKNDIQILVDRSLISRYQINIDYSIVYIDFDDCIYMGKNINIKVIAFLYQCVNKGRKIILLTKHNKDIDESLRKFKISKDLFDEIINIGINEEKYKYIVDKDSIFIDDSFSERKRIFEKCHIPVYDLDMIESLLDWRM